MQDDDFPTWRDLLPDLARVVLWVFLTLAAVAAVSVALGF